MLFTECGYRELEKYLTKSRKNFVREKLEDIKKRAKVVRPIEQKQSVKLGNGVVIEYPNGETLEFILEGYSLFSVAERISLYSPLGQAVFAGEEGEERFLICDRKMIVVKIKKIFTPSEANNRLKGGDEKWIGLTL